MLHEDIITAKIVDILETMRRAWDVELKYWVSEKIHLPKCIPVYTGYENGYVLNRVYMEAKSQKLFCSDGQLLTGSLPHTTIFEDLWIRCRLRELKIKIAISSFGFKKGLRNYLFQ